MSAGRLCALNLILSTDRGRIYFSRAGNPQLKEKWKLFFSSGRIPAGLHIANGEDGVCQFFSFPLPSSLGSNAVGILDKDGEKNLPLLARL